MGSDRRPAMRRRSATPFRLGQNRRVAGAPDERACSRGADLAFLCSFAIVGRTLLRRTTRLNMAELEEAMGNQASSKEKSRQLLIPARPTLS